MSSEDDAFSFSILHLSRRTNPSRSDSTPWILVNLVFRVFDEIDRETCVRMTEDWVKGTVYCVDNVEDIDRYYHSMTRKFEPVPGSDFVRMVSTPCKEFDISDRKYTGWTYNFDNYLKYVKKFDVFIYKDYVEDNPVTRAALAMLDELKNGEESGSSRFVPFSTLTRNIRVLNTFWD